MAAAAGLEAVAETVAERVAEVDMGGKMAEVDESLVMTA